MSAATSKAKKLGEYLKSRRERLKPESAGIAPVRSQRRTPGLRREEVAMLAGVSVTYYTWLEQGRSVTASVEVIRSLAKALQLTTEESAHLYQLWDPSEGKEGATPGGVHQDKLQSTVDAFPYPAFITNDRTELLVWNRGVAEWLIDFGELPPEQRIFINLLFTHPGLRERIVDWEVFAQFAVSVFRTYVDQHSGDLWYETVVAELIRESPSFAELWLRYDIGIPKVSRVMVQHPAAEAPKVFDVQSWSSASDTERVHMCLYTPAR
ncbi:helix-turn-helix transcriptional regulator [Paenibacillus sp. 1P07SE]|uniref:helix-turn-helix transcriptional regulator n=1 Tax=Paenibacillus sp. 1P07SE TaxID=3132209 RepID=UPI0039A704D7